MIKNFYTAFKNNYIESVFILIMFLMVFSNAVSNLLLILLIPALFLYKKDTVFSVENQTVNKLFLLLLMYLIIKAFVYSAFLQDIAYYKKYAIVIILLIFCITKKEHFIQKPFVFSIFLACIISSFKIILFVITNNYSPLNNDFEINNVLVYDRPYIGFVTNIAVFTTLNLYLNKQIKKMFAIFLILFFISFLVFIAARLAILSLLICSIFYITKFKRRSFYYFISIITILFLFFGGNFKKRMQQTTYLNDFKHSEPRFIIWDCACQTIENNNWFFGDKSYKNIEEKLTSCYSVKIDEKDYQKKSYFQEKKYNSHNTFLDFVLIGGLVSAILLVFIISTMFMFAKTSYSKALTTSILLFMLFENIFHRQVGCFYFGIILFIMNNHLQNHYFLKNNHNC